MLIQTILYSEAIQFYNEIKEKLSTIGIELYLVSDITNRGNNKSPNFSINCSLRFAENQVSLKKTHKLKKQR